MSRKPFRSLNLEPIEERITPSVVVGSADSPPEFAPEQSVALVRHEIRFLLPPKPVVRLIFQDEGAVRFVVRLPAWGRILPMPINPAGPPEAPVEPQAESGGETSPAPTQPETGSTEAPLTGVSAAGRISGETVDDAAASVVTQPISLPGFRPTREDRSIPAAAFAEASAAIIQASSDSAVPVPILPNGARPFPLVGSAPDLLASPKAPAEAVPAEEPATPAENEIPTEEIDAGISWSDLRAILNGTARSLPMTGAIPFHFQDLERGVSQLLSSVSDLSDSELLERAGGMEGYLWAAAGLLVGAGVVQAAWTRRSQIGDQRLLGRDSVLARWGIRDDGRLRG